MGWDSGYERDSDRGARHLMHGTANAANDLGKDSIMRCEHRMTAMIGWLVPLWFLLSSCRPTPLLQCANGIVCPEGMMCADSGDMCIPVHPDEPGGGVCGDGVVESSSEWCDDGNRRAGDSCPSDCSECAMAWQPMPAGANWHLTSVWGTARDDLFAVGAIGPTLELEPGDLYTWTAHAELLGPEYRGLVVYHDGDRWTVAAEGMAPLYGVWTTGDKDEREVFAVGAHGTILHHDGQDWSEMDSGVDTTLTGIWGISADEVFAVGLEGVILRYRDGQWSRMSLPGESRDLLAISGIPGDSPAQPDGRGPEIFIGGADQLILRYRPVRDDGADDPMDSEWREMIVPAGLHSREINALWGTRDPDDPERVHVLAIAGRRGARYYDGNAANRWTLEAELDPAFQANFQGIWGATLDDVFAVDFGGVVAWKGGDVNPRDITHEGHHLLDVWGSGPEDLFAVGINGTIVHNARHAMPDIAPRPLPAGKKYMRGLWVRSPDRMYMVGYKGKIFRSDRARWVAMQSGTDRELYGLWGADSGDLYTVGRGGVILHHRDGDTNAGTRWTSIEWTPLDGRTPGPTLRAIWGQDSVSFENGVRGPVIHAVGSGGRIVERSASGDWREVESSTDVNLHGVWVSERGRGFAVGDDGTILSRPPGGLWRAMMVDGPAVDLRGVWGSADDDVFAVGEAGWVFRYDGNAENRWSATQIRCIDDDLIAVWGSGPDRVFAIGGGLGENGPPTRSELAYYDGERWTRLPYVRPRFMRALHGHEPSNRVMFTGYGGRARSLQLPLW